MDNSDISLLFYRYLCDVIGTEDVVVTRRQIYNAYEHVNCNKDYILLCSGSKAEGLEIKGSDFDIMFVRRIHVARVYENNVNMMLQRRALIYESNNTTTIHEPCPLVMDTLECKPGYTKLKIPKSHRPCTLLQLCDYIAGEWYIASKKVRENGVIKGDNLIIHGPCSSTADGKNDYVSSFHCKEWICQAHSWLSRSRHSWGSRNILDSIVDFGVLVVPIGYKNSLHSDIEWRISFSHAEKLLIWSFNHVQFICYALMKILLKEIIAHYTGDLLCSYFLKTIMFWIFEETNANQWEARNILSCFMSCLDRLIYCVQHKTCVHYFIPENDLFENRFNPQQHAQLLSTLNKLRSLGWTCLLQTQTLQSFKSFLEPSLFSVVYCNSYLQSLITLKSLIKVNDLANVTKLAIYHYKRSKIKFYIYMISILNQPSIMDAFSKVKTIYNDNKHKYITHRKCLYYLLIGLNHDAVSGWLRLASFFYVNKQYQVCKEIISDCLLKCTPDKIVLIDILSNQEQTRAELLKRSMSIDHYNFIKKYSICPVGKGSYSEIFPEEINVYGMEKHWKMHLSPLLYGWFLQFLCSYHLGNLQEKAECVHVIKSMINYRYYMFCGHDYKTAALFLAIMSSLKDDHDHY